MGALQTKGTYQVGKAEMESGIKLSTKSKKKVLSSQSLSSNATEIVENDINKIKTSTNNEVEDTKQTDNEDNNIKKSTITSDIETPTKINSDTKNISNNLDEITVVEEDESTESQKIVDPAEEEILKCIKIGEKLHITTTKVHNNLNNKNPAFLEETENEKLLAVEQQKNKNETVTVNGNDDEVKIDDKVKSLTSEKPEISATKMAESDQINCFSKDTEKHKNELNLVQKNHEDLQLNGEQTLSENGNLHVEEDKMVISIKLENEETANVNITEPQVEKTIGENELENVESKTVVKQEASNGKGDAIADDNVFVEPQNVENTKFNKETIVDTTGLDQNNDENSNVQEKFKEKIAVKEETENIVDDTKTNKTQFDDQQGNQQMHPILHEILEIEREVNGLKEQLLHFSGTTNDVEYTTLNEILIKSIIKLDNISTENNEEIKIERKRAIVNIQQCLQNLEGKVEKAKNDKDSEQRNTPNP